MMKETIEEIRSCALKEIAASRDLAQVEEVRVRYLGRKGEITGLLRQIGQLSQEQRPELGKLANEVKVQILRALEERRERFSTSPERGQADVTLPGRRWWRGGSHPLTQVTQEIIDIFHGMGFGVAQGPEVETEYYNFDALNTPEGHPARDLMATFYLRPGLLLRPQTSPVQIRVMERQSPPVRIIAPGRCYRRDAIDATHFPVFHQVEGLYVDKGVTFGDLKGTLTTFARRLLGPGVKVRFRPHFFPFTEPSAEYDFSCVMCEGSGCRLCKGSGWLEISGAGMVDPEVFKAVGYDPEEHTGYAFGMGVERIAMILYGIDDIRLFYENDLRFLRQF